MFIKDASGNEVVQNPSSIKMGSGITSSTDNQGEATLNLTESVISAVSNGTTAVSVFGSAGLPYPITIKSVYLIARDTTATNITVEAPASTVVATIAKGTVAGVLVGATSLANTTVPANTNVILDGSSTGVAQVFITYSRA
jgi:hypothetical protein